MHGTGSLRIAADSSLHTRKRRVPQGSGCFTFDGRAPGVYLGRARTSGEGKVSGWSGQRTPARPAGFHLVSFPLVARAAGTPGDSSRAPEPLRDGRPQPSALTNREIQPLPETGKATERLHSICFLLVNGTVAFYGYYVNMCQYIYLQTWRTWTAEVHSASLSYRIGSKRGHFAVSVPPGSLRAVGRA